MSQTFAFSNYVLHEYLLILPPSKEVERRIWSVKYEFSSSLGAPLATATAPHLTVVNFVASPAWEEKIVNRLRLIGMGVTPFDVELKDFGAFETSRAIYINVISKDAVQHLVQELKQARPLLHLSKTFPPYFTNNPHVTVCRGLMSEQYQTSSVAYSTRRFGGNFTASSMTLLKRPLGELKCSTVGEFTFQSNPQLPKQGSLFM